MEEHVKKQIALGPRHAEEVLEQGQMAGAGNGQEFGDPLDQPQEKCG